MKKQSSLEMAVDAAGGQAALARVLGYSPQLIWSRLQRDQPLSAEDALKVEAECGVSRHALRPDIFGAQAELVKAADAQAAQ